MKPSEEAQTSREAWVEALKRSPAKIVKVYPQSFTARGGLSYGLVRTREGRKLAVTGEKGAVSKDPFEGRCFHNGLTAKICDLSPANTACLMSVFPHTRPVSLRKHATTFGTGDRLGVAGPGHIRAVRQYRARPVLAQQSVRENTQTGRDFAAVVSAAGWAVFQENYRGGYGADGDHLKSLDHIADALRAGVSMITLDLSEQLYPKAFQLSGEAAEREFLQAVSAGERQALTRLLGGREFRFAGRKGGGCNPV